MANTTLFKDESPSSDNINLNIATIKFHKNCHNRLSTIKFYKLPQYLNIIYKHKNTLTESEEKKEKNFTHFSGADCSFPATRELQLFQWASSDIECRRRGRLQTGSQKMKKHIYTYILYFIYILYIIYYIFYIYRDRERKRIPRCSYLRCGSVGVLALRTYRRSVSRLWTGSIISQK